MESLIKAGRLFYSIGIICLAAQQFIYSDFRPVFLAPWPAWMHAPACAFIFGAAIAIAALFMAINRFVFEASIFTGLLFFLFFVLQAIYFLFIGPNSPKHLGLWTDPLKELALCGGAFVIAGSHSVSLNNNPVKTTVFNDTTKLVTIGRIFFSIMLIAFGIDHFYYIDFVATLVPSWIPGHIAWSYAAGVLLIGAGVTILSGIKLRMFAALTALMIFIWLIVLHIPRAVADPYGANGNEITSCFEALAFSGVALIIAFTAEKTARTIKTVLA